LLHPVLQHFSRKCQQPAVVWAATTPEVLFVLKMPFFAKKIQKQEILAFYKSLFSLKWEK
jgi:hypothetical protein